ncbi:hypothetical protein J1614_000454 [Plenodomus biglobosus]|nr:hypothetical protein J1614_000454 [Plenodomus biglobosus]
MSPPRNEIIKDALRRFTLLTAHLRCQETPSSQPSNPLDEYIDKQRNQPKEEVSNVRQMAAFFEAKMSGKERWDGWRWTPPAHQEFGVIGDGKGNGNEDLFADSDGCENEI